MDIFNTISDPLVKLKEFANDFLVKRNQLAHAEVD